MILKAYFYLSARLQNTVSEMTSRRWRQSQAVWHDDCLFEIVLFRKIVLEGNMMKYSALLLAAFVLQSAASAQKFENLDVLDQRIATATGSTAGLPGGAVSPLDRRLSMPACASQVDISRIDSSSLALYCAGPKWRIRVPLISVSANEPSSIASQYSDKPIVRRGDIVEARYEADDFDLVLMMVALENGIEGQTIRVKNVETGRQTSAEVTRPGEVSIFP